MSFGFTGAQTPLCTAEHQRLKWTSKAIQELHYFLGCTIQITGYGKLPHISHLFVPLLVIFLSCFAFFSMVGARSANTDAKDTTTWKIMDMSYPVPLIQAA